MLIPHLGLPYFQTFSKTGYEVTVIFHLRLLDESVKMAWNPLDFFLEVGEDTDWNSMKRTFDWDLKPSGFGGLDFLIVPIPSPLFHPFLMSMTSPSSISTSRKLMWIVSVSGATNRHVHFCARGYPSPRKFGELNLICVLLFKLYV